MWMSCGTRRSRPSIENSFSAECRRQPLNFIAIDPVTSRQLFNLIRVSDTIGWQVDSDRVNHLLRQSVSSTIDQANGRALLSERFHLKFHRQSKMVPVNVISVEKHDSRLRRFGSSMLTIPRTAVSGRDCHSSGGRRKRLQLKSVLVR